jgi:hypothetical protein
MDMGVPFESWSGALVRRSIVVSENKRAEVSVRVQAARVPLHEALRQPPRACSLAAVAQRERLEDRILGVRVLAAGKRLLELKLRAWAGGDHPRERCRDRVFGLAPVLLGWIPQPAPAQLQRSAGERDRRAARSAHADIANGRRATRRPS